MNEKIKVLFSTHGGYLTRRQIPDMATYRQITRLVEKGIVERVRRGVYLYTDEGGTMIDIDKVVPGGVLCLYSAWFYYDLTLYIPHSHSIAIERSRKVVLPDYPPITLYYWQNEYYELGKTRETIDGYEVSIYNLEKCVCDAVKFRNKVGIEILKEVIQGYIKRRDRNFSRLMEYAKKMRIEKIIRTYLEVSV